jgi:phenylalanyl-tRNA synthetase beta chain
MKVLYDWLKEFVDVTLSPEELRDRLSMAGIAVEGLEQTPAGPLLDIELTINRPDCLAHYGIAREVATLERTELRHKSSSQYPAAQSTPSAENFTNVARVEIESPELCGRYTARVIRGVKVQPSPAWLRQRLEALGQASINNVVDATNYVMLELGQPMHAFDLHKLADQHIVVRRARAGEKIRTLDGIERTLSPEMCVIADTARAVAIGGVMGGAETEISFATREILLESAWFDPISIRRTSKQLGLRTEASMRFERGADQEAAATASQACAALIADLARGEILSGIVDVYPRPREPLALKLSRKELLRSMGADVPDIEIEQILRSLGFSPQRIDHEHVNQQSSAAVWQCTQPSWRQDVTREVDLIEEVARHFGLDKFPPTLHVSKRPAARLPHADAEDRLRERLIGLGYHEVVSIPLVNAEEDALFRPSGVEPARISNPLAADASLMRSTGLVSMAHALAWNLNRGQRNVRLFEIGRSYTMKDGAPHETRILALGATGLAREKGVFESPREYEFADLKGDLDQLGGLAGGIEWTDALPPLKWQSPAQAGQVSLAKQPGDTKGQHFGAAGQLSQAVAGQLKIRQNVFLAELQLPAFLTAVRSAQTQRTYRPLSRFPSVERDFALVVRDGTKFSDIRNAIRAVGIAELASVEAIDTFRGKQLQPGTFSLLVRVTFQSYQTTLTEAQVADFSSKILDTLQRQLGASLRTN